MRVLMLPRYDSLGASSRLRMLQYIPALEAAGIHVDAAPLLDDGYVSDLYSGRVSPAKVLRAYVRRLRLLWTGRSHDLIWLEKELFPWLPAWLERFLLPGRTPLVVDYDDAVFHRYDQHRLALVRWLLGRKIDRVMRRADMVIVGNDYLAERARAAGAAQVEWLPTVVDLQRYPPRAIKETADDVVIGWIGSPATAHYLHLVAAAIAAVASRHAIRCVAIGARPDQVSGTPFEAWPWSESDEVSMLYRIDIGIMPLPDAPWEKGKCGYKLIQYMACGLPVVASPVGVNTQIVQQGETGELARSTAEWTQAIERLVTDVERRRRMGEAGRQRVQRDYSLQAQAHRLVGLLRQAAPRAES
ncbi:MAG: glycosyl transferase family 1 [Lysobacterales bacterium 63-13]|nr:MAG: glycosyl transferase family 1 [Xanthomonadales bacterium 63-13]